MASFSLSSLCSFAANSSAHIRGPEPFSASQRLGAIRSRCLLRVSWRFLAVKIPRVQPQEIAGITKRKRTKILRFLLAP